MTMLQAAEPRTIGQDKPSIQSPLTVVMPAYNEEGAIKVAISEVQNEILDKILGARLLVINDGSKDSTGQILDQIVLEDARIDVIHQKNGGHGNALMHGLDAAESAYVFLIDSDCQIPLSHFAALWEAAQDQEGGFGIRIQRQDAKMRLLITFIVRQLLKVLFGVRLHDANIPFKIVRRDIWQEAKKKIPEGTLTPSLFLAIFMAHGHRQFAQIKVTHRDRETGIVSIRRWKLLKFCFKAFQQMIAFRKAIQE